MSDKILIIENLLEKAADIIIGGGMAYTFFKAEDGNIGSSLCEDDRIETAKEIMSKAADKNVCLHLLSDSIIADKFANDANISSSMSTTIPDGTYEALAAKLLQYFEADVSLCAFSFLMSSSTFV